ncbi:RDD family protein [uncultured Nocardioides sp.]|uniref:RDD family protein n=1 Tax=uncultured Nocardioides sp. TaxID=198441 RepID=UPI00261379FE|nr:RDD family protein [uncultured Nocardioides sp.]
MSKQAAEPTGTVDPTYASWPRRMVALLVDWIASTLAVVAFVGVDRYYRSGEQLPGLLTLLVFVAESSLLTALAGGSFGKLVTGLRTIPSGAGATVGAMVNPLRLLARQALVALVIPPLVFKDDGRGLHDLAAGTRTVRLVKS